MGLRPAGGLFGIVSIEGRRENMKRRLLSAILAICMVLLLLPAAALADENYPVWVNGTRVTSANASNVLRNGTVSYTPAADGNPQTIILKGANITSLEFSNDLTLILSGINSITNKAPTFAMTRGAYVTDGKAGSLTIKKDSADTDSLTIEAYSDGIYLSGGDLTIESGVITSTATNMYNGICALSGGTGGGNIYITGGTVNAKGVGAGIYAAAAVNITGDTVTGTGTGASANGIQSGSKDTGKLNVSGTATVIGISSNNSGTNDVSTMTHTIWAGADESSAPR